MYSRTIFRQVNSYYRGNIFTKNIRLISQRNYYNLNSTSQLNKKLIHTSIRPLYYGKYKPNKYNIYRNYSCMSRRLFSDLKPDSKNKSYSMGKRLIMSIILTTIVTSGTIIYISLLFCGSELAIILPILLLFYGIFLLIP